MSRLPRFLPLVAVAIGGVIAINAVENGPGIIGAARAFAEGVSKPAAKTPGAPGASANDGTTANAMTAPAAASARPAPVCAPTAAELAKEAGLSPAELQVLQSLQDRRGQLDQREQGLSTELALLTAAEAKLDAKINTMNALKADMTTLLGQADARQQAEIDRLVKVFEGMKPKDSAARFTLLDDPVRLPIAAKMKERALSAMLAQMDPKEAKRLTESLAARFVAQANAARQAIANPASAAPQTAAVTPPAKPTQVAQANPQPATTSPAPARPIHHRPVKPRAPAPGLASSAPPPATHAAATKPTTTAQAGPAASPTSPPAAKPTTSPAPARPAAAAPAPSSRASGAG